VTAMPTERCISTGMKTSFLTCVLHHLYSTTVKIQTFSHLCDTDRNHIFK